MRDLLDKLDEALAKGKWREEVRQGVRYYANGPHAGKRVGTVRGHEAPKPTETAPAAPAEAPTPAPEELKDAAEQQPRNPHTDAPERGYSVDALTKRAYKTSSGRVLKLPDGKPSKVPYKSVPGSKANLVGLVAFGKAKPPVQAELNELLNGAELILDQMGISFKTPIDFVCQNVTRSTKTLGVFYNMQEVPELRPRINLKSDDSTAKTLMHEIGHAIDNALGEGSKYFSHAVMTDMNAQALSRTFGELSAEAQTSPYYRQSKGAYRKYLNIKTEMFARGFEVYAYVEAKKLVDAGKINPKFLEDFTPDLLKGTPRPAAEVRTLFKEASPEFKAVAEELDKLVAQYRDPSADLGVRLTVLPKIRSLEKTTKSLMKDAPAALKYAPNPEQAKSAKRIHGLMAELLANPVFKKAIDLFKGENSDFYSVVVPIDPFGRVLLGLRTEDGLWTTPAGGCRPGESPTECAVRELWEETGLKAQPEDLEPLSPTSSPSGKPVYRFLLRCANLNTTTRLDPDKEVKAWDWYAPADLPAGLQRKRNVNRLDTINEAYMQHNRSKNTEILDLADKLDKGGVGSGIRGHQTAPATGTPQYAQNERKEALKNGNLAAEHSEAAKNASSEAERAFHEKKAAKHQKLYEMHLSNAKDRGLAKGGEGSGVRGHQTVKPQGPGKPGASVTPQDAAKIRAKVAEVQPHIKQRLEDHIKALTEGSVLPNVQTKSGKPIVTDMKAAEAQGYTEADHVDAINTHHEMAKKIAAVAEKLKMSGLPVPVEAKKIMDFHVGQMKAHAKAKDGVEIRANQKQLTLEAKNPGLKKAITQMGGAVGDPDLNTSAFVQAQASGDSALMERFYQDMQDFSYGDVPRQFALDRGVLHLSKVDDGMYSGFFVETTPEGLEDKARVRIDKLNIPDLAALCAAKEWVNQLRVVAAPEAPAPTMAMTEPVVAPAEVKTEANAAVRILELVAKLTQG